MRYNGFESWSGEISGDAEVYGVHFSGLWYRVCYNRG